MANLKDVQDIMKYIEEITSKLQYSSFEVALLKEVSLHIKKSHQS